MTTKPPSGTRDFLPADIRRREYVVGVVRRVYERHGFEPLETPAFENIETLLGKYGEEGNKLIFKILKRGEHEASGEADLALRYDLTVPLARVVAQYQNDLPKFFKRYQIQPVWRADRPAKGRFREFYQCDIDSIGSTSPMIEAAQLGAVSEILAALGFADFRIRLNHRRLLSALLENALVPAAAHAAAVVALDKKDKIGRDGVLKELEASGLDAPTAVRVFNWIDAEFSPDLLDRLEREFPLLDDSGHRAFANVREILSLSSHTAAAGKLFFEPSLARGLSYYTGAIMEIAVPDLAGSLGGGGRYDNLIGMFLGRDVPACGFSLGLERILVVMTERRMFPDGVESGPADAMVVLWNNDTRTDALRLAGQLRAAGLRIDVYPDAAATGKQLSYADGRGIPFAVIEGDNERTAGTVNVKNLKTKAQETMPRGQAPEYIRRQLSTEKDV